MRVMAVRRALGRRLSSAAAAPAGLSELQQKNADHLWHPMTNQKAWTEGTAKAPPPVVKARGVTLHRADGSTLIDGIGGLWCVNAGYGRSELADVARDAMMDLAYLSPVMGSVPSIELAAKLGSMLQLDGGTHVFFTASGSEANESAFKMARMFHVVNEPAGALRYKIIARHRAYHGNTLATMAATGQAERKTGFGPMPGGYVHVSPPYPYRRHVKLTEEEHTDELIRQLDECIQYEGKETVAAFIMEPFISGGGVLIPGDDYLRKVRAVCDKHGVLLILDEVVSGFARTGKMFGHQHFGVKPDIMTMAKGLTSGYMPLAAIAASEKVFKAFQGTPSLPARLGHFRQINTYGGHPVACAIALKNIEILEREDLAGAARDMGEYLKQALRDAVGDCPFVGDIRGKGLLVGVELVTDRATKEPLPEAVCAKLIGACAARGVIVGRNGSTIPGLCNVLIIAPPLVITKEECDTVVACIKAGLAEVVV
ncbi:pyridoxal phosphate-dependent transferase [Pelagophyceae sp. CCMP2097]|nr:pyridoxal phosphate-dependent transferase [Pelagophyceae sp. CCMP2097]